MFNKKTLAKQYRETLKAYGLTTNQLVVGGGGALVMLGIRADTQDIDTFTSVFDVLPPMKSHIFENNGRKVLVKEGEGGVDFHAPDRVVKTMIRKGVRIEAPADLLAFYKRLNRPKDHVWIKALEVFLQCK
jgi:hypothetical protein